MTLTGHSLIAGRPVVGVGKTAFGFNPATNEQLIPAYSLITEDQLTTATTAAAAAHPSFSTLEPETHAAFVWPAPFATWAAARENSTDK